MHVKRLIRDEVLDSSILKPYLITKRGSRSSVVAFQWIEAQINGKRKVDAANYTQERTNVLIYML